MQIHRCERLDYLRCSFVSRSHWSVADVWYRMRYLRMAHYGRSLLQTKVEGKAVPVRVKNAYGGVAV